jgi:hypothetical protein
MGIMGPELPSALLGVAARGERWEKKCSLPEPSCPGHYDYDAAEAEICRVFMETCQALHTMCTLPSITNARYPKAMWTHVVPLALEGPGARRSLELPTPGQVSVKRSESTEEASSNWVAHFDDAQPRKGFGDGVLLVSPMGQIHKYVIQLALPREG